MCIPATSIPGSDDDRQDELNAPDTGTLERGGKDLSNLFDNLGGWFTENGGQTDNDSLRFIYEGPHFSIGFYDEGYQILYFGDDDEKCGINIQFLGANKVRPEGLDELSHKTNHLIGNDPSGWQRNLSSFRSLVYRELYDGIDLVFYFSELGLKYDFRVLAGGDPVDICLLYEGMRSLDIGEGGDLVISTDAGDFREHAPYSYQPVNGEKVEVPSHFVTDGRKVGFEVGDYDVSRSLIIDPLIYSTYIGGSGDEGYGFLASDITIDSDNNSYIIGQTVSTDFPTTPGCYDDYHNGNNWKVFVCKLNPDGTDLIFSTLIGGSASSDFGYSIALDSGRNSYITGITGSSNFPTTDDCYDNSYDDNYDVFVTKLNQDGTDLIYSTFVGESRRDAGESIDVDVDGNAYVVGCTASSLFPTTDDCFDDTYNGGDRNCGDVFVFRLNHNGSSLDYSTFIGGWKDEWGLDITLDPDNNVFITGHTTSDDFPTTEGCFDDSYNGEGDDWGGDVFVTGLKNDGSDLLYSTFVGGSDNDKGACITLDGEKNAVVAGETSSFDFYVTENAPDRTYHGNNDAFIFRLNADGSDIHYSSFLGGDQRDKAEAVVVDPDGNAYITGYTNSSDFPTTPGCYCDSNNGDYDVFVTIIDEQGSTFQYSTYFGGDEGDYGWGISLDDHEVIYVVGKTFSPDIETTPTCFDDSYNYRCDMIVFSLNYTSPTAIIESISPSIALEGDPVHFAGNGRDTGEIVRYSWLSSIDGEIYNDSDPEFSISVLSPGQHVVYLMVQDDDGYWSPSVNDTFIIHEKPEAHIDHITPNPATDEESIHFGGYGIDDGSIVRYVWRIDQEELNNGTVNEFSLDSYPSGSYDVYFKVQDDYEVWSDEVTRSLLVHEVPTAEIISISPNPGMDTDTFRFEGSGTDDGTISRYSWRTEDLELYNGTESEFSSTDLHSGVHKIYFKVRDDNGVWSQEVHDTLEIRGSPVAEIISISPNPAAEQSGVTFKGKGIDDGTITRYVWRSNMSGEFLNGSGDESSYAGLPVGNHTISLKVRDNHGLWSDEVFSFLTIHSKPGLRIESITPSPALENEDIRFLGVGEDDGEVVRYVWYSSINNEIYNGTEPEFTISDLSIGYHIISLRVQDNEGAWSELVSTYLAVHRKPIAIIHSISPELCFEGEEIEFSGYGIDDGVISQCIWRSSIDGEFFSFPSGNISYDGLSAGTHTIYFKVRDNHDVWSEEVSIYLIISPRPVAVIDSIDPVYVEPGISVQCAGHGEDNWSIVAYSWRSDIDGTLSENPSFSINNLSNGAHRIYLRVQNEHGVWSWEANQKVIVNCVPICSIGSITPNPSYETVEITFTSASSDDGQIENYVWRSSIDGEFYNDTKSIFTNSYLSVGNHTIFHRVGDEYGEWSEEVSTYLMIEPHTIEIWSPSEDETVSGRCVIEGMASPIPSGENSKILIRIDDGEWEDVEDSLCMWDICSWEYNWNTYLIENGPHTIHAKAFNGRSWSEPVLINVIVENGEDFQVIYPPKWEKGQSWTWSYTIDIEGMKSRMMIVETVVGKDITKTDNGTPLGEPCYKLRSRMTLYGSTLFSSDAWLSMETMEVLHEEFDEGEEALFLYGFIGSLEWPLIILPSGKGEWSDAGEITVPGGSYHCYKYETWGGNALYYSPQLGHVVKAELIGMTYILEETGSKDDDGSSIPAIIFISIAGIIIVLLGLFVLRSSKKTVMTEAGNEKLGPTQTGPQDEPEPPSPLRHNSHQSPPVHPPPQLPSKTNGDQIEAGPDQPQGIQQVQPPASEQPTTRSPQNHQDLTGLRHCPQCGEKVPEDFIFCTKCGSREAK